MDYPGSDDYALLQEIVSAYEFESLEPRQDLVPAHDPLVRAAILPGDDLVLVYTPESGSLTVDWSELDAAVQSTFWVAPATGRRISSEFSTE